MARSKPNYYAVARGRKPGIYYDCKSCKAQVDGYSGAKYKGFPTESQAQEFVQAFGDYDTGSGHRLLGVQRMGSTHGEQSKFHDSDTFHSPSVRVVEPELSGVPDHYSKPEFSLGMRPIKTEYSGYAQMLDHDQYANASASKSDGWTVIWTDGSARGNGQEGAMAGIGVWFGRGDPRNLSERLQGPRQTNQRAELTAIIRALETVEDRLNIVINSDSQYAINCLTSWHQAWARNGWRNTKKQAVENKDLVQHALALINGRSGQMKLVKVAAHCGLEGNEAADRLANEGAMQNPYYL